MNERSSPIGFWKYPAAGESRNGRWVSEELSRGTTPTFRNPAIDFTNYKHPVARSTDFGGEAARTDNRYKLVVMPSNSVAKAKKKARVDAPTQLYDLVADPLETTDIAAQHSDVVERMLSELVSCKDP